MCQSAKNLGQGAASEEQGGGVYSGFNSEHGLPWNAYKVPARDHNYKALGYAGYRKNRTRSYTDLVIERAKKTVDPRKYSKQLNWSELNNGFKWPKEVGKKFIDVILKDEKKKPGPLTYKAKSLRSPRGFSNLKTDKFTLIDSLAYES